MGQVEEKDVLIRPARINDVGAMAHLLGQLFTRERDYTPDLSRQHAGLGLMLSDPNSRLVLVAELEGEVIGMATLQVMVSTAEGGYVGMVEDVVVTREHRGKGVRRALLNTIIRWSAKRGLTRLQLLVDSQSSESLQMFSANGWRGTELCCLRLIPDEADVPPSSASRPAVAPAQIETDLHRSAPSAEETNHLDASQLQQETKPHLNQDDDLPPDDMHTTRHGAT